MARIDDALSKIQGRRAVVVGDLMLDAYVYGETVRVSREAPVLVVRKQRTEHRLGGAANTAANLRALGVETLLIGAVAKDEPAQQMLEMLEACGVQTEKLRRGTMSTPLKTRVLAGAFGTSKQQVLRLDDEPDGGPSRTVADGIAADLKEYGRSADVVVVSDYGLGVVTSQVVAAAQELARGGKAVCVDSRYAIERFSDVTVVKPNVPEAEALTNTMISNRASANRAAAEIVDQLRCYACLLTQGRQGMTLVTAAEQTSHAEIVGEEEVTDVTGAGDTVIAAFSAAMGAGLGMENAMRLASVAAGIVVTKMGTASASAAEIAATASEHSVELLPWE